MGVGAAVLAGARAVKVGCAVSAAGRLAAGCWGAEVAAVCGAAVEAQAVDRAHRIGQTRPVFAYRLIARDTVEEKVLELQKTKRELGVAILGEDNSLIRDLKREDLELLLS